MNPAATRPSEGGGGKRQRERQRDREVSPRNCASRGQTVQPAPEQEAYPNAPPGLEEGVRSQTAPRSGASANHRDFFFFLVTQEKFQNPRNVLRRPQRAPGAPRISLGRPCCPHPHLPQPLQKPGFPSLSHTRSREKPFNWADKTVSPNSEDREPRPPLPSTLRGSNKINRPGFSENPNPPAI